MAAVKTPSRPTKVKIGCITYRILWDGKRIDDDPEQGEDSGFDAFCDHTKLIIVVNPDHAPGHIRKVLLHEILHCCLRASGAWPNFYAIEWVHNDKNSAVDVEEFVVAATAGPLLSVLQDNPSVLQFLLMKD